MSFNSIVEVTENVPSAVQRKAIITIIATATSTVAAIGGRVRRIDSAVEETENAPHVARLKAITTVTPSIAT